MVCKQKIYATNLPIQLNDERLYSSLSDFGIVNIASHLLTSLSSPEQSVADPVKLCWEMKMSHLYLRLKKRKSIELIEVDFWPMEKEHHILECEKKSGCSSSVPSCFSEF